MNLKFYLDWDFALRGLVTIKWHTLCTPKVESGLCMISLSENSHASSLRLSWDFFLQFFELGCFLWDINLSLKIIRFKLEILLQLFGMV